MQFAYLRLKGYRLTLDRCFREKQPARLASASSVGVMGELGRMFWVFSFRFPFFLSLFLLFVLGDKESLRGYKVLVEKNLKGFLKLRLWNCCC